MSDYYRLLSERRKCTVIQSTSHNSDHTGLADFARITENPDYIETFSVSHFNRTLIGLSNSVRNIQKSG